MIPSVPDLPLPPAQPRNDRLIALFLLGIVCFAPPMLRVFGVPATVLGWPVLFVYVFLAWAALVLLTALDVERRSDDNHKPERGPNAS